MPPTAVATGAWPERLSALESELDELLDAGAIPGLSIAVVADDQVWTREAGVLRRGASEARPPRRWACPNSADSRHIAVATLELACTLAGKQWCADAC